MTTSCPAQFDVKLALDVPFETLRQAEIACKSLLPDPILKASELNIVFSTNGSHLICSFEAMTDRVLRVALSNTLDNLKTIVETMENFDDKRDTLFQV